MPQTSTYIQRRILIEIGVAESSCQRRKWTPGAVLIEVLRKSSPIAVNVEEAGDPLEDVVVRGFALGSIEDRRFSPWKHRDLAPLASLAFDDPDHKLLIIGSDVHIAYPQVAQFLTT